MKKELETIIVQNRKKIKLTIKNIYFFKEISYILTQTRVNDNGFYFIIQNF